MAVFYPQCRAVLSVVFDGFGGQDSEPTVIDVFPRSARVCLNSYKEADSFEMEFDGKALPISPDMIRGAGVQIYMFTTETLGEDPQAFALASRAKLAGLVDKATLSASTDGVSFKVSGRDYTALMIDKQWDPTKRLKSMGLPLDQMVQELVDEATQSARTGRTLTVRFIGDAKDPSPPTIGGLHYKKTKKRGLTPQGVKNYWDVIYQICLRSGFIVYVQGFEIIISRPHILQTEAREILPQLVYGKNLEELEIDRKLGKERVPQIVVRSYDPVTRTAIEARFPESKDKVLTGVGTEKDEVKAFTVPGVSDIRTLKRFAENAYNSLARGESMVHFATKTLRDLTGDHDLLELRAGSAVEIKFDPYVADATLGSLSREARYDTMISLGYKDLIARLVANEYEKINYFRRPFYVKEVTLNWDFKDGLQVEVEAMNFIAVNRDEARSA